MKEGLGTQLSFYWTRPKAYVNNSQIVADSRVKPGLHEKATPISIGPRKHMPPEDWLYLFVKNKEFKETIDKLNQDYLRVNHAVEDTESHNSKLKKVIGFLEKTNAEVQNKHLQAKFELERQIAVIKKKELFSAPDTNVVLAEHRRRCIGLRNSFRLEMYNDGIEEEDFPEEMDVIESVGSIKELSIQEKKEGLQCPSCGEWFDIDISDLFEQHTYNCYTYLDGRFP